MSFDVPALGEPGPIELLSPKAVRKTPPNSHLYMTEQLHNAVEGALAVCDELGVMTLEGPVGTGKSAACDVIQHAARLYWDVIPTLTRIPPGSSAKTLVSSIATSMGVGVDGLTKPQIEDRLHIVLAGPVTRLLIFDEAQEYDFYALEAIRYLLEGDNANCAAIFCGAGVEAVLGEYAALDDRIDERVYLEPLTGPALHSALRGAYPILAGSDAAVLDRINEEYCHGSWRRWTRIVRKIHAASRGGAPDLSLAGVQRIGRRVRRRPAPASGRAA